MDADTDSFLSSFKRDAEKLISDVENNRKIDRIDPDARLRFAEALRNATADLLGACGYLERRGA